MTKSRKGFIGRCRALYQGYFTLVSVETTGGPREVVVATDSVSLLLYCRERDSVLLISEPRAAMATETNPQGVTAELVAGRFDHDVSPKTLAVEEALQEAGVTIAEADIVMLNHGQSLSLSSGMTNEKCYLMFAPIGEENIGPDKEAFGVAAEGEQTKRVWLKLEDFRNMECSDLRVFTMRVWFFTNYLTEEI